MKDGSKSGLTPQTWVLRNCIFCSHSAKIFEQPSTPLLSSTQPTQQLNTMGKGKNHDRKADPSFGKVKSSAQKGEFTLKRVKGMSYELAIIVLTIRRELLPRCQISLQAKDAERRKGRSRQGRKGY